MPDSRPPAGIVRVANLAIAATPVAWALARGDDALPPAALAALLALALAYVAIEVLGARRLGDDRGPGAKAAYLALPFALATAMTLLARGNAALTYLPPLVVADFWFGARGAWAFALAAGAVEAAVLLAAGHSRGAVAQDLLGLAGGAAFVIAFARALRRASLARRQAGDLAARLTLANERLAALASQAEENATLRERTRIARELHDTVGHYLTVVAVQAEAASALVEADPPRARDALDRVRSMAAQCLDEVRVALRSLRDEGPPASLPEGLRAIARHSDEAGLPVEVRLDGDERPCPAAVAHALLRAAQEGLTNVRRHARASSAEVIVAFEASRVRLRVEDDGLGYEPARGYGYGLRGLDERARSLGGAMALSAREGRGTALEICLPLGPGGGPP